MRENVSPLQDVSLTSWFVSFGSSTVNCLVICNLFSSFTKLLSRIKNYFKLEPVLLVWVLLFFVTTGYCSPGWKYFQGSCYFFSTTSNSWSDSQAYCQQSSANLLNIGSMQENDYIKTHTNSERWIGLKEVPVNKMNWTDDSIEPVYVNWEPGEPVYNDSQDDCTYFTSSSGTWHTKSCDEVLNFVCEKGKASARYRVGYVNINVIDPPYWFCWTTSSLLFSAQASERVSAPAGHNKLCTPLNAPGVYLKLGIVYSAFIWPTELAWAFYSWSNGLSSLLFAHINRFVISAAYYGSNK